MINMSIPISADVAEVIDGITAVLVKKCKSEVVGYLEGGVVCWNEADRKMYRKIIKACDTLLAYYGEPND